MNYELFALIVGFMGLAFIMNRNTVTLMGHMEQMRKETNQRLEEFRKDTNERFDGIRTETGERIESMRQEMNQFRTEMNRRFDQANMEMNRCFDTISHDIADLRERMTRVGENLKTRDTPNQSGA